jgi:2-polyprenyl-3-methyl-5-hydroxy-6-metoxy-1,4-benzoquinol methylase
LAYQELVTALPSAFWGQEFIKILDVGCDHGNLLVSLGKNRKVRCYGVEVSPAAASMARRRGINVFCGPLESAPRNFRGFHLSTLIDVIEHVVNPVKTLEELYDRTKPGGYLYLETPNLNSLVYKLGILLCNTPMANSSKMRRLFPREHIQYFCPLALKKCLKKIGWKIVRYKNRRLTGEQLAVSPTLSLLLQAVQLFDDKESSILTSLLARRV